MTIFATLTPIDLGTNTRVTVRVCAVQDLAATGAADQRWWPAIVSMPVIQSRFFDGDFSSSVQPASATMAVRLDVLIAGGQFPGVERYDWAGASCLLQRLSGGALVDVQQMQVESFASEDFVLALNLQAAGDLFDAEVLRSRYAGTTGAEGGADLRGQLKPWAFGRCVNVEPVFIDQIDNVFQVSGYGAVQAISAVYERGASFGASIGNFANYAALVAANIPEGRWGTCLAEGMFRLGAPPAGVITCDVDGDNVGGFLRRTGAILSQIATRIGLVDKVNAASMTALDTAVARNVNIVLREQTSFMELAQRMLAPCNAVASVGGNGRLIASRVAFGAEQFALDAQGREMPPVLGMARQNTSAPYKRIQMGAARSWRVHTFDEIAFFADLIDRGLYDAAATYREGNIVQRVDKSSWVYINPTASTGNAPPTWPTASNAFWSNLSPPASADAAVANASIVINGDGEIEGIGTGSGTPVDNGRAQLSGPESARPGGGGLVYVGLQWASTDTGVVSRWSETAPGVFGWVTVADITTTAIRVIEPQFPVIEVKQGEAGHTGNRTVTHVAKRGTATLTGGTWSLPSENLGTGDATINSSTGTVTLSGIVQSGAYGVRYTHTDGIPTDLAVNVTYVPTPAGGVVSAKVGQQTSSAGTSNVNTWQNILTLTMTGCPAGRVRFSGIEGLSFLEPQGGTGTADFEARLQLDGVTLTPLASQAVVSGGVLVFSDFSELFNGSFPVTAGTRVFSIDLRRTTGGGTITSTSTALEATIIAS